MSPLMAQYGYEAPSFVDLMFGDSKAPQARDVVQQCQDILKALKNNLQIAQNQQRMYADQQRVERSFEVGDMVYLRLQSFRQSTLKKVGVEKLKPRFYGPFRVIMRVDVVAYKLEVSASSKVHNVFHVSRLKKVLGHNVVVSSDLPPLDEEGQLVFILKEIIDSREHSLRRRTIKEYLVKWKSLPVEDATWENDKNLQHPSLWLLEDKQSWGGRTVISPSRR
ncbi:uncharacterized protein LOC131859216 [Cryptomeria japonica]|uniref:uncharacterized protein LOC131859216 n=1 Tax=Cryptomeria japonica TaxID=3369 RepID=UPI0027DA3D8B|nr:uncharacterized protein LOC131859216 [Cryptomeria japonica]